MQQKIVVSEQDHIERCKAGDAKSQEWLYKSFFSYSMGVSLRYLNNRDDSMEVVNDSFIKVFKAIQFFNESQPFKAWLRRIVINTAIDHRRKNLKHANQADIDDAVYVGRPAEAVENLSVKDILSLIKGLPEMHKMVFNMYEIDGYSHEEIGSILNIPVSSSRVYLSRAKERLRKNWNQEEGHYVQ